MLRRKFILVAVVLVPLLSLCLVVVQRGRGTNHAESAKSRPAHPTLEAIRVNPPGELGQDTECPSFAEVDFTYRIVNHSDRPLLGLKLGTKCGCEALVSPPSEIPPGESALVGFRLRAPYVGRLQRQIPLSVEGSSEPLLVFEVALRVKFDPPALIPPPKDLTLSFVKGDGASRELVLETIESKHSEPWMTGLELNPSDAIEVHPHRMEEMLEQDPELTRRRYHFPLANRSLDIGQHSAAMTLRTRQDVPSTAPVFSLRVAIVDSVAIVPNPLVIRFTPRAQARPKRVSVINRTSTARAATPIKYDEDVLRVRVSDHKRGSSQTFDVVPLGESQSVFETPVIFDIGNGETRELLVRFEESTSP